MHKVNASSIIEYEKYIISVEYIIYVRDAIIKFEV